MKFSLMSDLHVDFPQPKIPYDQLEELVVIAGDTSNGLLGTKLINKIQRKGHKTFAVDGNHEHYSNANQGRTWKQTQDQFYSGIGQNNTEVHDGICFIGVNGWYPVTEFDLWSGYMNDHKYSTLSQSMINWLAGYSAEYVAASIKAFDGPCVVVTHTAPCTETLHPGFAGHYSNQWYWNPNMRQVLAENGDKILAWCHGHCHASADVVVDGVRVVCNPRGYPGESPNWKPKTIEVFP